MFLQRSARQTVRLEGAGDIGEIVHRRRFLFAALVIWALLAICAAAVFAPAASTGPIAMIRSLLRSDTPPLAADPTQGLPIEVPANKDVGLMLYRNPKTAQKVVDFYTNLSGSAEIANIIIKVSNKLNVPLSLAFALAWKESRFSPGAVNFNGDSVDRGLYQLNSLSFPSLKSQEFYDPLVNAERGLGYLSSCLKTGGNEIVGLAMYNAGMSRVVADGTPRITLDYISTILKYQDAVITEFQASVLQKADVLQVMKSAQQAG